MKIYATLSDGSIIENPKHLYKYQKKLAKAQRRKEKKKNGSHNRFKMRLKERKIQRKIKNVRKDFLYQTTARMIAKYDGFIVEDLNIAGMLQNHKLAKAIQDCAWYEFKRQLIYKSKWNGKWFIEIDRWEPTSKRCSGCGHIQKMSLSIRTYTCPECGLVIDRDLNAAINIRNVGLQEIYNLLNTVGRTEIYACGRFVKPKQLVRVESDEAGKVQVATAA